MEGRGLLFQVAGIRRDQIKKLNANGIYTMEALGKFDGDIPKIAEKTRKQLVAQARLQTARKNGGASI